MGSFLAPVTPPSPPTRVVWGKLSFFSALEAWFYRKLLVLRTLEAKFLKKKNLCGFMFGMKPGVMRGLHGENTTLTDRVEDCGK
jgi:hypothetical protein